MSLTFYQFMEAHEWEDMDKRLNKLIGFNPATKNNIGGQILLYNHRINSETTDKEILEIRAKYVQWRKEIFILFKKNNCDLTREQFCKLFWVFPDSGIVKFLGCILDLDGGLDFYRSPVESYIKGGMLIAGKLLAEIGIWWFVSYSYY